MRGRSAKYDLTGQRFDTFIVISRAEDRIRPNGKKRPVWLCQCDCGLLREIESQNLHNKFENSCECKKNTRDYDYSRKHGMYKSREYSSWSHMKGRCKNPKEAGYENYGARGITYQDSWEEFSNFYDDLGPCPEGWVLDRIDPDKNYCKENCRWVDRNLSSFNTRKAKNNSSGRTGVYWFKRVSKWTAAIHYKDEQIHLGYFNSFEEACKAREAAELKYFGEVKN